MKNFDCSSAFGKYAPQANKRNAIELSRAMPANWLGRKAVSLLRSAFNLRDFGPYDIAVFGQNFRLYPSTNRGDKNVLTAPQFFDPAERAVLTDFFAKNPDAAFVDLGANIGVYSAFAHSLGFDKIVAIEADPEVFDRLNFNLDEKIVKLNIAIADADGVLPFYINEQNRGQNSLVNKTGREVMVPARPLLAVLKEQLAAKQKYALKIDVEGMEEKILTKVFAEADDFQKPELIIIEHLHAPAAIATILQNGYAPLLKTKLNMVLQKNLNFEP